MKSEHILDALGQVKEEYIAEAAPTKNAGRTHLRVSRIAAAVCAILVLAAAILLYPHIIRNPNPSSEPGALQSGSNDAEHSSKPRIVVNQLDGLTTADMDVQFSYYDGLSADVWESVCEDFRQFTGIRYEDFASVLTNYGTVNHFYSMAGRTDSAIDSADAYQLHDYIFDCQTQDGGNITVAICPFEEPLRDCFIITDNPEQSEIDGVSLVIYGYNNYYLVRFSTQNLYYDIETTDVSLDELQSLLTDLIAS